MGQSLEFRQGLSARETHRSLQAAARNYETARQHVILWFGELNRRKLYQDLGYATILMYAEAQLGWEQEQDLRLPQDLPEAGQAAPGEEGPGKRRTGLCQHPGHRGRGHPAQRGPVGRPGPQEAPPRGESRRQESPAQGPGPAAAAALPAGRGPHPTRPGDGGASPWK